ncbi:MAG: tetratricopeptide repeat protein [Planctomycetota bacterium]
MSVEPHQPGPDREREYSPPADGDRFGRLAAAFEQLRSAPPAERQGRLAEVTRTDPEIADELAALLAQHSDDPDDLGAPERAFDATVLSAALHEAGAAPVLPQQLGPYRVLRLLGHGGMGSVCLAEHEDRDLGRQVAVKVLRTARHDPELLQRFRNERRILASLQHANIATLFDGGSTADGQPFVAMEYVAGRDLLADAEARQLGVDDRVRTFVKVCRAVAHAHRALVVHRDLKPSNVLVTAEGEPKLLDFGIAKLLDDDDDGGAPLTGTGSGPMTPEYSSPEQVRGEAVTTSTDVYALGALLYELLTGERAQPRTGSSMAELIEVVCDRSPQPASLAVRRGPERRDGRPEPRTRWSRRLEGDLDTIVATAMRKEPERRYATAEALADDLERHLRGLPVTARPDTLTYRTRKFVRRNRLPVTAAALLLATLVTFAVVTARDNQIIQRQLETIRTQNQTIRSERDAAIREGEVTDQVVEFLASLYEMAAPDPDRAETLRARELLDRGARRIARELQDLPDRRAPLQLAMGRSYVGLGLYDDARPLLEAAERTFAALDEGSAAHREAQFVLGGLYLHQAEHQRGERLLRASWQDTGDDRPLSPLTRAARRSALAGWLREQGRYDEALQLVAAARRIAGDDIGLDRLARAGTVLDVVEASILSDRGDLERARDLAQQAIERGERRDGEDYGRHANLYRELGQILSDLGDLDGARDALLRALELDRAQSGEDHPDVDASLFAVAMIEVDRGEWRAAADKLREVLARDLRRFGAQHPYPALTRAQLAMVLGNLGDVPAAESLFAEALATQRELLPADHPELATTIANLGSLYNRTRRYDLAAKQFEQALAIRQRIFPPEHPTLLTNRQQLAVVELGRGNAQAAEAQFRELLKLRRQVRGEHPETAGSLLSLATCIARQGRPEEAIPLFVESTAMFRRTLPEGHDTIARPLLGEALAQFRCGRPERAEPLLREADAIRTAALGEHHFLTLYTRYWLVRVLAGRDDVEAARSFGERTLRLLEQHLPDDRLTGELRKVLASLPS